MTVHIIFFSYVLATLQRREAHSHFPTQTHSHPQIFHPHPHSGFANAAQLSEIVCENTT